MKNLLLIFTLLFTSVFFSSPSYAEWTKVIEGGANNNNGDTGYVDYEGIRKHDGFVYWWYLNDYLKPDVDGVLSSKVHHQGDCKLFGYKFLSVFTYKKPMGAGTGNLYTPPHKWRYPSPNTIIETLLKSVCNR